MTGRITGRALRETGEDVTYLLSVQFICDWFVCMSLRHIPIILPWWFLLQHLKWLNDDNNINGLGQDKRWTVWACIWWKKRTKLVLSSQNIDLLSTSTRWCANNPWLWEFHGIIFSFHTIFYFAATESGRQGVCGSQCHISRPSHTQGGLIGEYHGWMDRQICWYLDNARFVVGLVRLRVAGRHWQNHCRQELQYPGLYLCVESVFGVLFCLVCCCRQDRAVLNCHPNVPHHGTIDDTDVHIGIFTHQCLLFISLLSEFVCKVRVWRWVMAQPLSARPWETMSW